MIETPLVEADGVFSVGVAPKTFAKMIASELIDADAEFGVAPMDNMEGLTMISVIAVDPPGILKALKSARAKHDAIFGK